MANGKNRTRPGVEPGFVSTTGLAPGMSAYSLAVALPFALAACTWYLAVRFGKEPPASLYVLAVATCGFYGGPRPAALALLLGACLGQAIPRAAHGLAPLVGLYDGLALGVFLAEGLALMGLSLLYRQRMTRGLAERGQLVLRERLAKQDAKNAADRLHFAQHYAQAGTWEWEIATNKLQWSPECYLLHGFDPSGEAVTYEQWNERIAPEDRGALHAAIEASLRQRQEFRIEFRFVHASLGRRWFSSVGRPEYDAQGVAVRMRGIALDTTEQRLLQEEMARLSEIVESSRDAIISCSLEGTITSWNDAASQLFGWQRDDALGQSVVMLAPAERGDEGRRLIQAALHSTKIVDYETQRLRKDGTLMWVSLSVSPLKDKQGQTVGVAKIVRDISKRRRAEELRRFLVDASEVMSSSLDYQSTMTNLVTLLVPTQADWASLFTMDEHGKLKRVAMAIENPTDHAALLEADRQYDEDPPGYRGLYTVMQSGEPVLYPRVSKELLAAFSHHTQHQALMQRLGVSSAMLVPLAVHGKTYGVLVLVALSQERLYDERDLVFALDLGRRSALALENAKLYGAAQDALAKYERALEERREAENALRNSERLYRAIGESIDYGVWVCDAVGRNLYASESFLRLTGMTQAECSQFGWGDRLHPTDARATMEAWQECVKHKRMWDRELRFKGVDGRWHSILARGMPVYNEAGEIIYWAGINLNIDRMKQTEDELRHAKQEADEANAAKSAFLANMSHEIRTPLGAILGFAELLQMDMQNADDRRDCVEVIRRNGFHLSRLIDDILDLSKVEAGSLSVVKRTIRLSELMDDVRRSLHLEVGAKGLGLDFVTVGQLPAYIYTDDVRLKQILINVVGNAVKFTSSGGINVAMAVKEKSLLSFVVSDTGRGIEAAFIARLFEPFSQADPSYTRLHGGTGLGLALARRLARHLGGDLTLLRTALNEGSSFEITIDPQMAEEPLVLN